MKNKFLTLVLVSAFWGLPCNWSFAFTGTDAAIVTGVGAASYILGPVIAQATTGSKISVKVEVYEDTYPITQLPANYTNYVDWQEHTSPDQRRTPGFHLGNPPALYNNILSPANEGMSAMKLRLIMNNMLTSITSFQEVRSKLSDTLNKLSSIYSKDDTNVSGMLGDLNSKLAATTNALASMMAFQNFAGEALSKGQLQPDDSVQASLLLTKVRTDLAAFPKDVSLSFAEFFASQVEPSFEPIISIGSDSSSNSSPQTASNVAPTNGMPGASGSNTNNTSNVNLPVNSNSASNNVASSIRPHGADTAHGTNQPSATAPQPGGTASTSSTPKSVNTNSSPDIQSEVAAINSSFHVPISGEDPSQAVSRVLLNAAQLINQIKTTGTMNINGVVYTNNNDVTSIESGINALISNLGFGDGVTVASLQKYQTVEQLTPELNNIWTVASAGTSADAALQNTYVGISVGANFGPIINELAQGVFSRGPEIDAMLDTNRWRVWNYAESKSGAGDQNTIIYFDSMLCPILKTSSFDPSQFVAADAQLYKSFFSTVANVYGVPASATGTGTNSASGTSGFNLYNLKLQQDQATQQTASHKEAMLSTLKGLIQLSQETAVAGTNVSSQTATMVQSNLLQLASQLVGEASN